MKTFWLGIKNRLAEWNSAWDLTGRSVLFHRQGETLQFVVIATRRGKQILEQADEIPLGDIPTHPKLKACFAFPRVWRTRFGAALPLEKAQIQEWKSELKNKKQVLQVLPYELSSSLPYPTDQVLFDSVLGRFEEGMPTWQVATALKKDIEEEISFWKEQGLVLDFLDWEGNVQCQLAKKFSLGSDETWLLVTEVKEATHFVAVNEKGILAQKVYIDPSIKERQKRLLIKEHSLLKKEHRKSFKPLSFEKQKLPFKFPNNWTQRVKWLFAGLATRSAILKNNSMNFLKGETRKEFILEMAQKKVPALVGYSLVALLIFQGSIEFEKWSLKHRSKNLKKTEVRAIQTIAQKTGLSEQEIRRKPLTSHLLSDKSSLLNTFVQTAKQLSETSSRSYRGHSLELSLTKFILEGEADTFAEVETIERDLAKATTLSNVRLAHSQKSGDRVIFKIEADRNLR